MAPAIDFARPPEGGALPDPAAPLRREPRHAVHEAFLAQAAQRPGAAALEWTGGRCTYGELERVSAALARRLRAGGVGKGSRVAILSARSPGLVYAMLGVLRAGAAFFVADAAYPERRNVRCLARVAPALLLTCGGARAAGELLRPGGRDLDLLALPDDPAQALAALGPGAEAELGVPAPDDPAYVSFTSGSTGEPKGIVTPHAPLPHFVAWHARAHALGAADRFSLLSGLSHDPMLRDVFTPLSLGATLCIPEQATIFDPFLLADWLDERRVTTVHLTPAIGEIIATGAEGRRTLDHVRWLFWGGDTLSSKTRTRMAAVAPRAVQVGLYGTTETPQGMASVRLDDAAPGQHRVGRGIDDVQLLVMTEGWKRAGPGEVGEIWIRTPFLSTGYLDAPEETAQRFVPNPCTGDPLDRCYRTGDLGSYLEDGTVVFHGRADHQVKIRGFRVELGEVTAAIERLEGVTRAVALVRQTGEEAKVLVAYYTCRSGKAVPPADVRAALRAQLPGYMVPAHLVPLAAFPLFPNGKIDLQALPAPAAEAEAEAATDAEGGPPATPQEEALLAVWREILGLRRIGLDDSFQDLGGDSLSAIRAVVQMRRLGIPYEVGRRMLQGWTVRQIAASAGAPAAEGPALAPKARTTLLVNVVRGLLVAVLVADHWSEGFFNLLGPRWHGAQTHLGPLVNVATPGFALVFGLGLGYVHYFRWRLDPEGSGRTLRLGALLVTAGVLLGGFAELAVTWSNGERIDSTVFFNQFYSALPYYAIALLTAPAWFWIIDRSRRALLAVAGMVILSLLLFHAMLWLLLAREQTGFLQFCRLLLVAKFNYFNLSAGVLAGVGGGIWLHQHAGERLAARLLAVGGAAALAGLGLLFATTGSLGGLWDPVPMPVWRWVFYAGALLLVAAGVSPAVDRVERLPGLVRAPLQLTAVFGQIALPVVVFHRLVLEVKHLLVAVGLRPSVALALPLLAFFGACGWAMRKLYRLYYGGPAAV